jgi:aryl-alcohol dehydrogenase-like predicted oxidoreductase
MIYRKLGNSDLVVSAVGFGCWAIGGHRWGPVDDQNSKEAIAVALHLGVNFFDTADVYGFGHSEELLGEVLQGKSQHQSAGEASPIVATKVGLRWNSKGKVFHDLSYHYVKQACDASLKRLKRDVIDLYQLHWPDPNTPLEETFTALTELREAGKVRYVGVSNFPVSLLQPYKDLSFLVSYQGIFNLFNQEAAGEVLPFCQQHRLGFIAYEPLSKGLLTGKFQEKPKFPRSDHRRYEPRFTSLFLHYQPIIKQLQDLAATNNLTLAQISLALLLYNETITTVIPGIKTAAQIRENTLAADLVNSSLLAQLYQEASEIIGTVRVV